MRVHLTRAATFGPICRYLEAGGTSVSRRLTRIGISSQLLGSPETLVPLQQCCRFVDRTISRDGINDFGMEAGSRTSIGDFGLFGMVLRQSLTLKDLLDKLIRWMPIVNSGARAWLETPEQSDSVRLCIEHEVDLRKDQVNEYGLMLLIDAVRLTAGSEWRPEAIWLNRERAGVSKYEAVADASVHHRSHSVGFLIPRRLLSEPVRRESTPQHPTPDLERSLKSTAPPKDLVGTVSYAIRTSMQSRVPDLDQVADLAGTSRRAMQRRLRSRGTTYRDLLDRVRFEKATTLLSDEKMHVSEVAYELGYTELSNFTHAFVRWTGISPTEYREMRQ